MQTCVEQKPVGGRCPEAEHQIEALGLVVHLVNQQRVANESGHLNLETILNDVEGERVAVVAQWKRTRLIIWRS